jgi:hypothetical protein
MIRRAVEGFRWPDDFRQLSPSATASGKSALPLRGHPPLGRTRAEGEGEVTQPWTKAETRRLRAWARKKVSAEDVAKSLGRHVGSVKKKARELGLILFKKVKAKPKS